MPPPMMKQPAQQPAARAATRMGTRLRRRRRCCGSHRSDHLRCRSTGRRANTAGGRRSRGRGRRGDVGRRRRRGRRRGDHWRRGDYWRRGDHGRRSDGSRGRQDYRGWGGHRRTCGARHGRPGHEWSRRRRGSPGSRPGPHPVSERVPVRWISDHPGKHQGAPSQQRLSHGGDWHFYTSGNESRYGHRRIPPDRQQRPQRKPMLKRRLFRTVKSSRSGKTCVFFTKKTEGPADMPRWLNRNKVRLHRLYRP